MVRYPERFSFDSASAVRRYCARAALRSPTVTTAPVSVPAIRYRPSASVRVMNPESDVERA